MSALLDDGQVAEMVYRPEEKRSAFAVWNGAEWSLEASIRLDPLRRLVPYSPENNLVRNEVVLFSSAPEEYGSEDELIDAIEEFLHRYVDLSPLFGKVAAYYVLFSWVYDAFQELPYLRFRGDYGSGKTRALLTVGSLCYKPIFASGASTVSPIFRILDAFRGTLVVDEADFRLSDERAEVVKILNNGNVRGFPVLRSEVRNTGEINPTAYHVFGPKLVATRGTFEDRALESRFLTEEMGTRKLREDVPINLPERHKDEARHLRNKLLLFRFRNLGKPRIHAELVDKTIEPRLNQVFVPLLSIIQDPKAREDLRALARRYNQEIVSERGMDSEAQVLEVIRDILASPYQAKLTVKEITSLFSDRHGEEYERKITPKWVGTILRKRLNLKTQRTKEGFAIPTQELPKLRRLYEKYGLEEPAEPQAPVAEGEHGERGELPSGGGPEEEHANRDP